MPTSPKIDVVGVGLNAPDTLIPVQHFPAAGSKIEFRSANVLPGGQVATAMVACQSWGLRTRYVGKVGDDPAATASKHTCSPRPGAPASKRSSWSTTPANARSYGNGTNASRFSQTTCGMNGSSAPAHSISMATTPPPQPP